MSTLVDRVLGRVAMIERVGAKFKEKKKTEEGNTVYLYSEKQIQHRNRKKAERLEKLTKSIEKLRTQVKKDLKSKDRSTQLTALAIALIDHTFERVGNEGSADEGHFGVTGWQKSHVTFGKGKATIKYVGKSGVKQEKTVDDADILAALKDAHEGAEDDAIFTHKDGKADASKVNAYLKDFDVTAKDIRGLHANLQMREALKKVRKGKLPEDKKEREKKLKEEWKEALEIAAEAVGHEPATLGNQYLVPGLEDAYMKDGSVPEKMKLALDMTKIEVEHLEKWKKDLRMMTKIYKSIDLEDSDRAREEFVEARDIFRLFVANFDKWVYKVLLPNVKKSDQTGLHKEIATKAWTAKAAIDPGILFPTVHNGGTYVPAPWMLRNDRDKNIAKYNKAFNEAFKAMAMYIEWNPTKMDRVEDEVHNIAGATIIVEGFGRGEFEAEADKTIRTLAQDLARINQAGFSAATKGLTIRVSFESKNLTAGQYNSGTDEITIFPLGMDGDRDTMTHEIGHRYWYRAVPGGAQARWEEIVESRTTEITRTDVERFFNHVLAKMKADPHWSPLSREMLALAQQVATTQEDQAKFETMADGPLPSASGDGYDNARYRSELERLIGKKVLIDGVSDYATTNPKETFAEVFMGYVVHGPGVLSPFMRQLFMDTCRAGGARLASLQERVLLAAAQRTR